jgi:O-antigen/teichoic acid export membrane protein/glycosyltransferase involved in cell wall biosynthesis
MRNCNNQGGVMDGKIKVLYGITLSDIGGAQSVLHQIISSLNEDKYEITLVTSPNGDLINIIDNLNKSRVNKIEVVTMKNLKRELAPLNDFISFIKLIKLIRKGHYDVVHLHSSKMGFIGPVAAKICGVPKIIFTVHGFGITDQDSYIKRKLIGFLIRFSNKLCSSVVCVSNKTRLIGIENKLLKENNSVVIYNGTNDYKPDKYALRKELNISPYTLVIGTVMRLAEPKDPFFTIRLTSELISRGYNINLVIIGDGPLMEPSIKLAQDLNIESQIFFLGKRNNVRDLIEGFDIFALFSKSEALPMSIIEAMFAAKPIVASSVGGIEELVYPYKNGFLIHNESIEEAAKAIEYLINHPSNIYNFGYESFYLSQMFTSKKMAESYEKLYTDDSPEPKKNSIFKKFSWLFLGNLLNSLSKALMIIIITRLGTPSLVGQYSLSLAITTPIFSSLSLGLRTVYITDRKDNHGFNNYFNIRLASCFLGLFISVIISLFFGSNAGLIIISAAICKFFEYISDMLYGLFQKLEKMSLIGISKTIKSLLSLFSMGIVFYLTRNLFLSTTSAALVWGISLFLYDIPFSLKYIKFNFSINKKISLYIIKVSLPLGIVLILDTLNSYLPTYFIGGILGSDLLGYYSSIAYLVLSGDIIINSIGETALPKLSLYYKESKDKYYKSVFSLVTLSAGLGLIALMFVTIFGRFILTFIYNSDYGKYYNIFIILMASYCILYISSFLNKGIDAAQKFKVQQVLYFVTVIVNLAFYFILIKEYGLIGACYAALISSQLRLLGNLLIFKSK